MNEVQRLQQRQKQRPQDEVQQLKDQVQLLVIMNMDVLPRTAVQWLTHKSLYLSSSPFMLSKSLSLGYQNNPPLPSQPQQPPSLQQPLEEPLNELVIIREQAL